MHTSGRVQQTNSTSWAEESATNIRHFSSRERITGNLCVNDWDDLNSGLKSVAKRKFCFSYVNRKWIIRNLTLCQDSI